MRSMTGFGVGESDSPLGRVVVETRSVNHRSLDVRVRLPRELADHGLFAEQVARAKLSRGRVEVSVHCEGATCATVTLDRARALAALREFAAVAQEAGLSQEVPLSLLASVPDLFAPRAAHDVEAVREALRTALERSIVALDAMRDREGAALREDLGRRLDTVATLVGDVRARADGMGERYRDRLRARLARLTAGVSLDSARLEHEVAVAVDHADVSEELTRLASHVDQLMRLAAEREPVGRRFDFLLQEMAREANTLGAKCTESEVSLAVVELKSELERMREQVQNIE